MTTWLSVTDVTLIHYTECIVDTRRRVEPSHQWGCVIQSYGGSQGSRVGQLSNPRDLAVDGYCKVLVADSGNNRVVSLSPSLTHLSYVTVPGHLLNQPCLLYLDQLHQRNIF